MQFFTDELQNETDFRGGVCEYRRSLIIPEGPIHSTVRQYPQDLESKKRKKRKKMTKKRTPKIGPVLKTVRALIII